VDPISLDERLSRLETHWSVLQQAHGGPPQDRERARHWLVERYEGVVRRYLTKAVGPDGAAELVQEFATRVLEGRYHNAQPAKGRFRDYLKTCLFALVNDYRKSQVRARIQSLPEGHEPADYRTGEDPAEDDWRRTWRQDLIDRTLESLRRLDQGKDRFLYAVLRLRMEQPDLPSDEAATLLSERIGKQVTDGWLRKKLMRARQRFAGLLLEEVARSVDPPTRERVTDELTELNLLPYCGPHLKRLREN
jgi:RNA polymerase sigma-70 factor (ECF subfamily)